MPEEKFIVRIIIGVLSVMIVLIVFVILNPFVQVSAGERGVVLVWGKVQEQTFGEGLHIINPIGTHVEILDIKTQKEQVSVSAASKDLQTVTTKIALNYHLNPDKTNFLWQSVGKEYKERIIDPAIQEAVKAVTAHYTAEELITKRSQVKDDVKISLIERLQREYIIIDEFSIVDFDFSPSFNAAIESKVTAEQNALAAKNKLEQVKFEAEQRVTQAKGEAEAIRIQAAAIQNQGGAEYVNLKAIEKWNGNLPQYMLGQTTPFINLNK